MSRASKGESASEEQLLEMIEFIKESPILITNKPNMKERDLWKKKWEELCVALNEIEGPTKTVSAWQKEWNLLKNLTKEKVKNIDVAAEVRSPVKYKLSHIEEKVVELHRFIDDVSMDTTLAPEDTSHRRAPKRQNSVPIPEVPSVQSPSPSKRNRKPAEPANSDDVDVSNAEFLQSISAQLEKQNDSFLNMADSAASIAESLKPIIEQFTAIENNCKMAVATNIKLMKLIESKMRP